MTGHSPAGPSRRDLLAVAGTAALGGCAGLSPFASGPEPTYLERGQLAALVDEPSPAVPRDLPVPITADHLERSRALVAERLSAVPDPLGPDDLPNGAIREAISGALQAARSNLERASSAATRYEALPHFRFARGNATSAATAWRAVEGEVHREAVEASAEPVREDLDALAARVEYVGDEVVPTVVVYDAVEGLLARADRDLDGLGARLPPGPVGAPLVGRLAGQVEAPRAALDDAAHLDGRHRGSADRLASHREPTDRGAATLSGVLDERLSWLPGGELPEPSALVDADVSDTPAEELLRKGRYGVYGARPTVRRHRDAGRTASAAVTAHRALVAVGALRAVRDRIDAGERFRVETADDVRAMRESAVAAVADTVGSTVAPPLARDALATAAASVRSTDEDLAEERDRWSAGAAGETAVEYVWAAEVARAVPPVTERAARALGAGSG